MLCEDCEQRVRVHEDRFKAAVWNPWCAKVEAAEGELPEDVPLSGEPWMELHTLSMVWRALHVSNDSNRRRSDWTRVAQEANEDWRPALLDGRHPPSSRFWVMQSQAMDRLLQRRGHKDNGVFILLKTFMGSSVTTMGVRPMLVIERTISMPGRRIRFPQATAYGIGVPKVDRGFLLGVVKAYGFCFVGVHARDRAVMNAIDPEDALLDVLCDTIKVNREMDAKLSPKQRENDEAACQRHAAKPTLTMKIKAADERKRRARENPND